MKKLILLAIYSILMVRPALLFAESQLNVVATLSTYADIAKSVGGELIDVKYVASPKFNPHFIEPRPSDVLKLKNADLFIHSGLDLEAWRGPLLDAAARADMRPGGERQLDLSTVVKILEVPDRAISRAEGDIHFFGNPHYWLDPNNGKAIAREIAAKLISLDASRKDVYASNLAKFQRDIVVKIDEWTKLLAPYRGRQLIGYHNEWIYLISFSNLVMEEFLEPKPGIPPTAKHIESIIGHAKENKIGGIVLASFNPSDAAKRVAKVTGAKVLSLCQNVGENSETPDYLALLDYDIRKLVEGLSNE